MFTYPPRVCDVPLAVDLGYRYSSFGRPDDQIRTRNPHLYREDLERIVNSVFDEITVALNRGDRVELRGFGVFLTKRRPARTGRNPRDGAQIQVSAKRIPAFKSGKEMHERLNAIGDAARDKEGSKAVSLS